MPASGLYIPSKASIATQPAKEPLRQSASVILLFVANLQLGLGVSVVKVACRVWLKDNASASDASVEVVDVVGAKIAGELDQRNAQRLFDDLEVSAAKNLGGLREHECCGMPDNKRNAGHRSLVAVEHRPPR